MHTNRTGAGPHADSRREARMSRGASRRWAIEEDLRDLSADHHQETHMLILDNATFDPIFKEAVVEIAEAREKHGDQKHLPLINCWLQGGRTYGLAANDYKNACDDASERGEASWDLIFLEEVYEALEAAQDNDLAEAREEFIQVIAMAASMVELIDERSGQ